MGARQIVQTLEGTYREHGSTAMLHDLRCRALHRLVQFQQFEAMAIELQDLRDATEVEAPGFAGRFVGPGELRPFAGRSDYDLEPGFVARALSRGDRCHALFDGDQLVSYGWYSSRPTSIDQHFLLRFDPRFVYMYKGYTLPAYRGRRLYGAGMAQALRAVTAEGQQGLVCLVATNNFPSLRSTERLGYRIFGRLYLARVGELGAALATRGCQRYQFQAEPRTPPLAATQTWLLHALDGLRRRSRLRPTRS